MPLRLYICKKCKKETMLFDDEVNNFVSSCTENSCELEQKAVDTAHTAGTTEMYSNRHIVYDTMGERIKWNNADIKRKEQEEAAKRFQDGLKKL
jgi:hypothetical protein